MRLLRDKVKGLGYPLLPQGWRKLKRAYAKNRDLDVDSYLYKIASQDAQRMLDNMTDEQRAAYERKLLSRRTT